LPSPLVFAGSALHRSRGYKRYRTLDGCGPVEPALVLSLARLAMKSTVQPGPGKPFGDQRDGAPSACSEHLPAVSGGVSNVSFLILAFMRSPRNTIAVALLSVCWNRNGYTSHDGRRGAQKKAHRAKGLQWTCDARRTENTVVVRSGQRLARLSCHPYRANSLLVYNRHWRLVNSARRIALRSLAAHAVNAPYYPGREAGSDNRRMDLEGAR
jgi:hypothetical protein